MTSFEINPLDINIAKIQLSLIQDFEKQTLKFPIEKTFDNQDPTLKISRITVTCKKSEKDKKNLDLDVEILDRNEDKKYLYTLHSGSKEDILNYLKEKIFLFAIKELTLKINEVS